MNHHHHSPTVVFYPSGGVGHINPMVELAKLFINHNFRAIIVLTHPLPSADSAATSFTSTITSSNPSISFHHLPPLPSPPSLPPSTQPLAQYLHVLHLNNPLLSDYLSQLAQTTRISALVLDLFCFAALDVARELQLPCYFYFTSTASSLSATLCLTRSFLSRLPSPIKDLGDSPLHFPGLPPIPATHLPVLYRKPGSKTCKYILARNEALAKGDGIIVNTFEALESSAVKALADGPYPPCYCIGPLLSSPHTDERHGCLTWLDGQPNGTVVFLSFGSLGNFSAKQLVEIAVGLEQSEQRFLWVVRIPKGEDPTKAVEEFLPEGFVGRTKGRGMVVQSWAPQVAVLRHEAVGGFVSHCGWNSTLEAVSYGVPMIAWPLYAEQWLNKVILVEEAKLAVAMEGYDREMVRREEVERKVRWLFESEGGKELKERMVAMQESAMAAKREGGSSDLAWKELLKAIEKGAP